MNDQKNVNEHATYLVEGVVSELHVESGTENLLARVDRNYKRAAMVTGASAVAADLFGQAATAASLAMSDEDTQSFICLIDGKVMCGQFGGAEWLAAGRRVRAVVQRRGPILYALGIVDEGNGLLWIGHPWGSGAEGKANFKIAGWSYLFLLICWNIFYFMFGGRDGYVNTMSFAIVVGAVLCFGVAAWANHDMQSLSAPSTEIYRLLGFARPEEINLNKYRISIVAAADRLKNVSSPMYDTYGMSSHQTRDVYCYKRAIDDGKLSLAAR